MCFHVLPVPVWVLSALSDFLPPSRAQNIRLVRAAERFGDRCSNVQEFNPKVLSLIKHLRFKRFG